MRKLLNAFLSPADRKIIVAAVRAAEARTAAEIVPMVVGASDSYPKAELSCAVAVGLVLGVLGNLAFGSQGMWLFLLFFSVFSLAAFEVAKHTPGLKRLFVSRERALHETRQAAQAAFFTHGLTKTRDRNAVLVYVSIFEHLVFIQPDIGLAGKLDKRSLDALTAALTADIRQGKQAAALVSTIEKLADLLAPHFPPREDDTNEIKDLILI
jgi:putative membrane protein